MNSILENWDTTAKACSIALDPGCDPQLYKELTAALTKGSVGWDAYTKLLFNLETQFAQDWVECGRIIYSLTHSIAALFSLTSAPSIERLPHKAFAIRIPKEFLPIIGSEADTWIAVSTRQDALVPTSNLTIALAIADGDRTASTMLAFRDCAHGIELEKTEDRLSKLTARFLSNVVAYVLDSQRAPGDVRSVVDHGRPVFRVRPPRDVVVDRELRFAARAAVHAESLAGVRRAMAHFVRGHWRNQAVGPGRTARRKTWVSPHKRGSESIGRVVSRIERFTERSGV